MQLELVERTTMLVTHFHPHREGSQILTVHVQDGRIRIKLVIHVPLERQRKVFFLLGHVRSDVNHQSLIFVPVILFL